MDNSKKIVVIIVLVLSSFTFYFYTNRKESLNLHSVKLKQDQKGMSVEDFQKKVANKNKVFLIYFHASWCVPCIKLKPEILELENETKAYCEILNIDVDENPKLGEYFEINTLPLLMIFKDGKKSWENAGSLTKNQLLEKINLYK